MSNAAVGGVVAVMIVIFVIFIAVKNRKGKGDPEG